MTGKFLAKAFRTIITVFMMMILSMCAINADYGETVLKKNMKHPDVAALEERLSRLGYLKSSKIDNLFDTNTEAAIKLFQKKYGLEQDGIAGKDTIRILNVAYKQQGILSDIKSGVEPKKETVQSADRASAARARKNMKLVSTAKSYLGVRYVWGASSAKGFDCSGFTMHVLKKYGVSLEHRAGAQFNKGIKIDRSKLWPGDLVFFKTSRASVGHVGIYIGSDKFIHASTSKRKVVIDSLSQYSKYSKYIGARRFDLK